jgi:hypothetical protein
MRHVSVTRASEHDNFTQSLEMKRQEQQSIPRLSQVPPPSPLTKLSNYFRSMRQEHLFHAQTSCCLKLNEVVNYIWNKLFPCIKIYKYSDSQWRFSSLWRHFARMRDLTGTDLTEQD